VFDKKAYGGNGDGVISSEDAIFSKLRIWVDANHDGVSQPGELFTMQQANVKSISLADSLSWQTDAYGNRFRYLGEIEWTKPVNGKIISPIYDVILQYPLKRAGGTK